MMIELNGRRVEIADGASVADAAAAAGIEPGRRGVAVALDGEVVPGPQLARVALSEGARVEVVEAIGGGAG